MVKSAKKEEEERAGGWGPKDLLLVLPLVGTTLAVLYDVGFFWSIDIRLFSAFSLTEHAVFALQATPLVLFMVMALVMEWAVLSRVISLKPSYKSWHTKWGFWIGVGGTFGASVFVMWRYGGVPGSLMLMVSVLVVGAKVGTRVFGKVEYLVFVGGVAACALAFVSGFSSGERTLELDSMYVIEGGGATIRGTLVRSSEKGMLLYDKEAKQLSLIPWAGVTKVSAGR